MRKRTKKQWYEYHRQRSVDQAQSIAVAEYRGRVDYAERRLALASDALELAKQDEPLSSRLQAFFGIRTEYRLRAVLPKIRLVEIRRAELSELRAEMNKKLRAAAISGAEEYRRKNQERKELRAAQKEERRLRQLERSSSLRSAARGLKKALLEREVGVDGCVACVYCGDRIAVSEVHLEHKRPISRGGSNKRSNLALSCSACNLRKGRKTHDEFM